MRFPPTATIDSYYEVPSNHCVASAQPRVRVKEYYLTKKPILSALEVPLHQSVFNSATRVKQAKSKLRQSPFQRLRDSRAPKIFRQAGLSTSMQNTTQSDEDPPGEYTASSLQQGKLRLPSCLECKGIKVSRESKLLQLKNKAVFAKRASKGTHHSLMFKTVSSFPSVDNVDVDPSIKAKKNGRPNETNESKVVNEDLKHYQD